MRDSMVDRIAIALMDMDGAHDLNRYVDSAYIILREIRRPTAMMAAVGDTSTWQAMIDEALKEPASSAG